MIPSFGIPREIREKLDKDTVIGNITKQMSRKLTEMEKVKVGTPDIKEMREGNLVLSFVPSRGLYLFVKYNNIIHHVKFTEGGVI
tara:strand:+ start:485 stop:739 length:255 start_codon:yes stop_codon:yes gene_type:complete